jgi:hypothetical protein
MAEGHTRTWEMQMPSRTKSHIMSENATLRARLAEREDKSAKRPSGEGVERPESDAPNASGSSSR